MNNRSVPLNATYFREYGIHPVKQREGQDYIASFPNWEDTAHALKTEFPDDGNIVTPEYIAAPDDLTKIKESAELIDDRIRTAIDLTKKSDATLHLSAPTPSSDRKKWFNSVLSIKRGKVRSLTHKTTLVPSEHELGISEPAKDLRTMKNGRAVLICAELFLYGYDPNNALQHKNVQQIFAPTMWATPAFEGRNLHDIEKAGGADNYYRQQLERAIGSHALRYLPTVQRIIVSDRGKPDLAPYNAIIDRVS